MEIVAACPRCGSREVLTIVDGTPGLELAKESIAGEMALGGSVVSPDVPDRLCQSCGHEWHVGEAEA